MTKTAADDRGMIVSREYDAPRELVWRAMTTPELLVRWWGPEGFTTTVEVMDVRPGGDWKLTMHGPDGAEYPNRCRFIEVVAPERIVYSLGGGRKGEIGTHFISTWTFEEIGPGRTRLTMRHVFDTPADLEHVVKTYNALEGGHQTLARLAGELARMQSRP